MASIEYVDVRRGMVLVGGDGQLYQCLDRDLNTPGNWRAILQLKLKNLKTGSITQNRVRPQDKVETKLLPGNGVYCVEMIADGRRLRGMANIGVRPTFTDATVRTLEVNLFDFDGDLYGQIVTVEFQPHGAEFGAQAAGRKVEALVDIGKRKAQDHRRLHAVGLIAVVIDDVEMDARNVLGEQFAEPRGDSVDRGQQIVQAIE